MTPADDTTFTYISTGWVPYNFIAYTCIYGQQLSWQLPGPSNSDYIILNIGNNNIIREFTAIQKPCYRGVTSVGNNVFLMQSVHIPHDAILEDDVVVTPMVVLAGITRIMQGANLGIGCAIHQYCVVGPYSIVGMGASLTKSLKPFSKFVPGKPLAVNSYAVDRYGFSDVRDEIENYLVNGISPTSGRLLEIVKRFESATSVSDRMVL